MSAQPSPRPPNLSHEQRKIVAEALLAQANLFRRQATVLVGVSGGTWDSLEAVALIGKAHVVESLAEMFGAKLPGHQRTPPSPKE